MKIIIAGCGRVGYALAQQLNDEGHELTLIDNSADRLAPALSNLDLQGIVGSATSFLTQKEAGVQKADLFIAVTDKDEVNLIACLLAKKASKCRTIARVRAPQYFREIGYLKECMDISMIINYFFAALVRQHLEVNTVLAGKFIIGHAFAETYFLKFGRIEVFVARKPVVKHGVIFHFAHLPRQVFHAFD